MAYTKIQRMTPEDKINIIKEYFTKLKPFVSSDDIPDIPVVDSKWCPQEVYDEYVIPNIIRCGAIPKSELKIGQWYEGDTRNASCAKWNGKQFEYERCKWGNYFIDEVNHFQDDDGYALFVPIKEIDRPKDLHVEL